MADWNDYRYFLAIARAGSLSGAARKLKVDQSTVGRRLAALESAVGVRLFDRTPDGYVLTAAGEGVRAQVESVEGALLGVERKLTGEDARLEGSVKLATSETFAAAFLVRHLDGLRLRHPGITIQLVTGNVTADLSRREADLAVRLTPKPRQPNLIARRLAEIGFGVYAAQSYLARRGRPGASWRGHDIVAYGPELSGIPAAAWLRKHASGAQVVFSASSVMAVHTAVAAGLGIGVLPCFIAERDCVRLHKRVVGSREVWMVVHPDVQRNARVRATMAFLTDLHRQEAALLAGASSA